jgi:hypothetical protein
MPGRAQACCIGAIQAAASNETTCNMGWQTLLTALAGSLPMSSAGTQSCSIWDTARSNNHRPKREATRPPSSMWEVVDAGMWAPSWANHTGATASTNEIACHQMPSTPVAFSPASCCFQYRCVKYYPSCIYCETAVIHTDHACIHKDWRSADR